MYFSGTVLYWSAELNRCDICNKRGDGIIARTTLEKMAEWREKGVKFTFGSDLHKGGYPLSGESSFSECEKILEEYGFTDDDFAQPF